MLLFQKFETAFYLGILNILRVIIYRFRLRFRLYTIQYINFNFPYGTFFNEIDLYNNEPSKDLDNPNKLKLFGLHSNK